MKDTEGLVDMLALTRDRIVYLKAALVALSQFLESISIDIDTLEKMVADSKASVGDMVDNLSEVSEPLVAGLEKGAKEAPIGIVFGFDKLPNEKVANVARKHWGGKRPGAGRRKAEAVK